jgi:hypothetical protein
MRRQRLELVRRRGEGDAGDRGDVLATFSAKPIGAFSPVPTAVPPCASSCRPGSVSSMRLIEEATCAA